MGPETPRPGSLAPYPTTMNLRKITKAWGSLPRGDALLKLFYLAQANIVRKWSSLLRDCKAALTRFTIKSVLMMGSTSGSL